MPRLHVTRLPRPVHTQQWQQDARLVVDDRQTGGVSTGQTVGKTSLRLHGAGIVMLTTHMQRAFRSRTRTQTHT